MQWEIINPSDSYTFLADNLEVAALTMFCISSAYGAKSEDDKEEVPIFMFGGAKEWYAEQFGRTPDEGFELKKVEIIEALKSVMLGDFKDRKRYEVALSAITDDEKRKEFIATWQDGCTSLNDIGTYCHKLAENLALKL